MADIVNDDDDQSADRSKAVYAGTDDGCKRMFDRCQGQRDDAGEPFAPDAAKFTERPPWCGGPDQSGMPGPCNLVRLRSVI